MHKRKVEMKSWIIVYQHSLEVRVFEIEAVNAIEAVYEASIMPESVISIMQKPTCLRLST